MGNVNKKGRSREARHARLYHRLTNSSAWFDLSGNAIKVLILLMRLENGTNNGELFLSGRCAADWANLSEKTGKNALRELEEHGFISATQRGHFQRKNSQATKWRLTWISWPSGRKGPTNDFEKWQGEKPICNKLRGQNFPSTGVVFPEYPEIDDGTGVEFTPAIDATHWNCSNGHSGKITPQTVIPLAVVSQTECDALRDEIRTWLIETGSRQKDISAASGISQPKLSRFLDPNASRLLTSDQFNRLAAIIRHAPSNSAAA